MYYWIYGLPGGVLYLILNCCTGCVVDLQSWGHSDVDLSTHTSLAYLNGEQVKQSTRKGMLIALLNVEACHLEGLEFDLFDTAGRDGDIQRAQNMIDTYQSSFPSTVLLAMTGDSVFEEPYEAEMVQMLATYFGFPVTVYPANDITGVSFAVGSNLRKFSDTGKGPSKLSFKLKETTGYYCKHQTQRHQNTILNQFAARSKMECGNFCLMSNMCQNFAYFETMDEVETAIKRECILYGDLTVIKPEDASFRETSYTCSETNHVAY